MLANANKEISLKDKKITSYQSFIDSLNPHLAQLSCSELVQEAISKLKTELSYIELIIRNQAKNYCPLQEESTLEQTYEVSDEEESHLHLQDDLMDKEFHSAPVTPLVQQNPEDDEAQSNATLKKIFANQPDLTAIEEESNLSFSEQDYIDKNGNFIIFSAAKQQGMIEPFMKHSTSIIFPNELSDQNLIDQLDPKFSKLTSSA